MAIKSKRIGEQVESNTLGKIRALNNSGVDIDAGDIVAVTGSSASGGFLLIAKADSSLFAPNISACLGLKFVAQHDIAAGNTGIVCDWRIVSGDTSAAGIAGAPVFLGTAGNAGKWGLTPTGDNLAPMGRVLEVANPGRVLLLPKKSFDQGDSGVASVAATGRLTIPNLSNSDSVALSVALDGSIVQISIEGDPNGIATIDYRWDGAGTLTVTSDAAASGGDTVVSYVVIA
jgi:hypothetical protein